MIIFSKAIKAGFDMKKIKNSSCNVPFGFMTRTIQFK